MAKYEIFNIIDSIGTAPTYEKTGETLPSVEHCKAYNVLNVVGVEKPKTICLVDYIPRQG